MFSLTSCALRHEFRHLEDSSNPNSNKRLRAYQKKGGEGFKHARAGNGHGDCEAGLYSGERGIIPCRN